jgi:hypothetical protein
MHTRASLVPVLVLLAVSGCTADAEPSSAPASEASAVAERSAPPSASAAVAQLEATGEPLPPGRYTRTGFEPRVTFELNGDWQAVQDGTGFFDVQQRVGSPDVIAVQFGNVTGVYGAAGTAEAATDHDDAERILRANPSLEVVESSESRIGGLTGSQVTVENTGELHASVLEVPPGALGIDPGRRLWTAFFDTETGVLAIMVGGSVAEWQAALDAAEPVLESIQIGE